MTPRFAYVRPGSLPEAVAHLAAPGTRVLSGGTDLLGCLRDGVLSATTLVSLADLPELRGIVERPDGSLRIGAMTTLDEIARHPRIRERWPALAQGALAAASPQLRNQGTLGGNLCQRPRCWYFRGDFPCARKGGDVCYAMAGENELHAIFGGAGCYMVHPSDTAPPLVALEARARIVGPDGDRTVLLDDFFLLPSQDITRENVLQPGELVAEVLLPGAAPDSRSGYRKVRTRGAWDFALAGVALALQVSRGVVTCARIVLSGVAPVPWRAVRAEEALVGRRMDRSTAAAVAVAAAEGAEPLDGNGYKVDLVRGVVEESLLTLA
jgi:xanthine dehydrogenase YagS FAD-binding subunit